MGKPRVLIVEDEPAIRDNIEFVLHGEGFDTLHCATGLAALPLLAEHAVDLIVLDVGLPDMNGFDLLKQIRKAHRTAVIMLTARNAELDRVLGLELGADDYVVKPFSPRELSARVKAVLRRVQQASEPPVRAQAATAAPAITSAFVVDASRRQISYFGVALTLSKLEYDLLTTLIRRPGHVFSREQLMSMVWQQPESSLDRSVDAHVKNLRAKLRAVRPDVDAIVTHRGSGYSLREGL